MVNSAFYREWAPRLDARTANMVSLQELEQIVKFARNPGFSSVYAFDQTDAMAMKASGKSRGFDQYTTASDYLPIDLDDGGATLDLVLAKLSEYSYKVYFSGKKGYHVILDHEFIHDKRLPFSHRRVVENLEIDCDMTLYQAGRIFRLPNCIHQVTGKRKVLVKENEGRLIDIPLEEKPPIDFNFKVTSTEEIPNALGRLWELGASKASEGQRHMKIWQTATDLLKAGFDSNSVLGMVSHINSHWPDPLTDEEVGMAVSQAARRLE